MPGAALVAVSILVLVETIVYRPGWTQTLAFILVWGAVGVAAQVTHAYILRSIPSVRRVGVLPGGVVVDLGFSRQYYTWNELHEIIHLDETRYPRSGTLQHSRRTRIVVGRGGNRTTLALSPGQADFLIDHMGPKHEEPLK